MDQFQLGKLPSENPHQKTIGLAELAKNNVIAALAAYRSVDLDALSVLHQDWQKLAVLDIEIKRTLSSGHRIFMAGCGATGRLVLGLEKLMRDTLPKYNNQIVSFMAGGDLALVHSLESFEDFQEYGARQLRELNFTAKDLFIGVTEGGETPFVIGATICAASISNEKVFYMFCNPTALLKDLTIRTRDVLSHPKISAISFDIGPMALAGSTRLQACTVMQCAIGALFFNTTKNFTDTILELEKITKLLKNVDLAQLEKLVIEESKIYSDKGFVHFMSDQASSLTVLTDTTERSPTFSLFPFENWKGQWQIPCWNYLSISGRFTSQDAWQAVLGQRKVRTLEWPELGERASLKRLLGFDISMHSLEKRRAYLTKNRPHKIFEISSHGNLISLGLESKIMIQDSSHFIRQTMLKIILNMLSTIVMGRVDRFESNIMTWVRPSNNKLIDRTIRNAQMLLQQKNKNVDYMILAEKVFEIIPNMQNDRSLVLELVACFDQH